MIKVIAKSIIKNGQADKAIALYEKLVDKSRQENGCISYELYQDKDNMHILFVEEIWEDLNALEAHKGTEHFKEIVPQISSIRESSSINVLAKLI